MHLWHCIKTGIVFYEAELGSNILIFETYITIIKHILTFPTYILKFPKHILAYTKHILILRTYILKFFKHIWTFTKHVLILRTDNNCFFKQVLIYPYRYYLFYRCYRTCQQELSCIKHSGQPYKTYHIQNFIRQGEMNINIWTVTQWLVTSFNISWCNLEAMSVFLVFAIAPPINIQIAIFLTIWLQSGIKSINNLSAINISVSKAGLSVRPFRPSFRQCVRSSKA